MRATPLDVQQYETRDGRCPFQEWLSGLADVRGRQKVRIRIDRLEDGNFGDCKPVGDGVFELRIDFGPGYRLYFARSGRTVVLLLCGGDKSSQARDIKIAKKYWKDYTEANH